MNCRKVNNLLSAYIDGELGGVEQMQVRQHLRDCCCCADEHESLLSTKRLLSGLCLKHPRPELENRILSCLNESETLGSCRYGLRVKWDMLPDRSRHFARLGAFCMTSSVALALFMVALTPTKDDVNGGSMAALPASAEQSRPVLPVRDAIFIHNPMESAPPGGLQQVGVEQPVTGARP